MTDEKLTDTGSWRPGVSRRLRFGRKALRIVVSIVVTIGLLMVTSLIVVPKNDQTAAGEANAYANGFEGLTKDILDVLFIGDSEAYTSLSPMQMWKEQGFTAYTSSTPGQHLTYGNTLLHRALSCQTPKVVVIETDFFYKDVDVSSALARTAQDVFPVLEYHNRWKSLTVADFTSLPNATWTDDNRGFAIKTAVKEADATGYMAPSSDVAQISSVNLAYIKAMVAYCRSKGVTPVFVSTPSTKNWNMSKHNGVERVASELGVDYVDLNLGDAATSIGIDWSTDSLDGGDHLNYSGAEKVSTYLGAYLKETYGLTDHRDDTSYSTVWNASLTQYESNLASAGVTVTAV